MTSSRCSAGLTPLVVHRIYLPFRVNAKRVVPRLQLPQKTAQLRLPLSVIYSFTSYELSTPKTIASKAP